LAIHLDIIFEELLPLANEEDTKLLESCDPRLISIAMEVSRVISIQETICNKPLWHIACLCKTSKACFALQALTRKKCVAKIVQGNRGIVAPTYIGSIDNYKKNRIVRMQFFFYNDDIE